MSEYRKILVRAANWLGDAVMGLPALQALRERYPAANITILARPSVAGLYAREAFCDELIPYEAPRGFHGLGEKRRLAGVLRKRKFDCALLLQNAFEAAALVNWAGIPCRVGYDRDARGWLLTHPIPLPKPGEIPKHQRFYYLELLKRARLIEGYSTEAPIRLHGARAAAIAGRERLREAALQGAVIGVGPGAAYGGAKRWLPERFAEAAVRVARERCGGSGVRVEGRVRDLRQCKALGGGCGRDERELCGRDVAG